MKLKKIINAKGPYTRKEDGRQHMCVTYEDGSRGSVSYPKYLVEQALGRRLDPQKETIDHIDKDFTNNDFNNLRIVTRSKHSSDDVIRVKLKKLKCIWCKKKFKCKIKDRIYSKSKGKAGPFCSRQCQGQYGADIKNHATKKLSNNLDTTQEYFYKKKDTSNKVSDLV